MNDTNIYNVVVDTEMREKLMTQLRYSIKKKENMAEAYTDAMAQTGKMLYEMLQEIRSLKRSLVAFEESTVVEDDMD